ncbi:MAG: hypothetical protein Kow00121_33600 [Elainellaceae cyanobacterium]
MVAPDRELENLKAVTTLVLYGWGYPALFNHTSGNRLQNRLVRFSVHTAPTIAGANQVDLQQVLPKLKLVQKHHRSYLKQQLSGNTNPCLFISVTTPATLPEAAQLEARQQFAEWLEQTDIKFWQNFHLPTPDLPPYLTEISRQRWFDVAWKQGLVARQNLIGAWRSAKSAIVNQR